MSGPTEPLFTVSLNDSNDVVVHFWDARGNGHRVAATVDQARQLSNLLIGCASEAQANIIRKRAEEKRAKAAAIPVDRSAVTLTDGSPVTEDHRTIDPATGQQKAYVVLSTEERAKGFVRPVRRTYVHVGIRPKYGLVDLTPEQAERYKDEKYVKYEPYPHSSSIVGRYWTQAQLESGCGQSTTMGLAIAETYSRSPSFYSGTMCVKCGKHFPVEEFVWEGTDERVGS